MDAKPEPEQKNERQQAKRLGAGQRALRDRVAAAHQLRGKPRQRPHCSADNRSARLDRPPVEEIHRRDGSEQQAIVDDRREPDESPEDKE